MFLLTGSSRTSLASLRSELRSSELNENLNDIMPVANGFGNSRIAEQLTRPGAIESHDSLVNLLDCCILYYYAVAHKYIIMASIHDASG